MIERMDALFCNFHKIYGFLSHSFCFILTWKRLAETS